MQDSIEKLFLGMVGGAALSYEKANEVIDELIEKGRITVEEGKELAEELKQNAVDKISPNKTENSDLDLAEEILELKQTINQLSKRLDAIEEKLSDKE